jgi:hypothetical protein
MYSYVKMSVFHSILIDNNFVEFEVLTAVSTKMVVFWVVAISHGPDDGGSKDL